MRDTMSPTPGGSDTLRAWVLRLCQRLAARKALLPVVAMAAGLAFPDAATAAFGHLPAILAMTLVCGLVGMKHMPGRVALLPAVRFTLGACVVAPCLALLLAAAVGADEAERSWVAFAAAAPVGGAAIAAAASCGAAPVPVAAAVLASLLAAPMLLPLAVGLSGVAAVLGPLEVAGRVLLLSGLPAFAALALRQVPLLRRERVRGCCANAGLLAVAALSLARMHGVADQVVADPLSALRLLGFATIPTLAGILVAMLLLWRRADAAGLLAGGLRNYALVWAMTADLLPPEGNLFMALTAIPVFVTPALVRLLAARLPGAADAAAAPAPFRLAHGVGAALVARG